MHLCPSILTSGKGLYKQKGNKDGGAGIWAIGLRFSMLLWPNKKQWKSWSLPSKITAIGTLVGIISLGLYIVDKTTNLSSSLINIANRKPDLDKMRMGISLDYIKTVFGVPITESDLENGNRELLYIFKEFYLQTIINKDKKVVFFAVTLRDSNYRYKIPYIPKDFVLGEVTYAEFGEPEEVFFSVGSKTAEYREKHYYGNPGYYMDFWSAFNDSGISFTNSSGDKLGDSKICVVRDKELESLRKVLRPNSIGISQIEDINEFGVGPSRLITREFD